MRNIFTVDIEDWYHTHDFNFEIKSWKNYEERVDYGTNMILELLDNYNTRATFFVLGYVAQNNPHLIKKIADAGHEIGSHGMYHRMVSRQNKNEFREDLQIAKKTTEDIIGQAVQLYRAPSWSVNHGTLWMFEILEEEGFICDSSIQPFRTPLSGMNNAPVIPFHPILNQKCLKLVEFPSTVLMIGNKRIPFAGGFYLRALPVNMVSWALKKVNKEKPGMVYVHPWELDPGQPRIKCPMHINIVHYLHLDSTRSKLEHLLKTFEFSTLGKYIKKSEFPARSLS